MIESRQPLIRTDSGSIPHRLSNRPPPERPHTTVTQKAKEELIKESLESYRSVMAECDDEVHECLNDGRHTDDKADDLHEEFGTLYLNESD